MINCILFSGACATIFKGTEETVYVRTTPPGASVTIDGREEEFLSPCHFKLPCSEKRKIRIALKSHKTVLVDLVPIDSTLWGASNAYNGFVIGALVDWISGAGKTLSPSHLNIVMQWGSGEILWENLGQDEVEKEKAMPSPEG